MPDIPVQTVGLFWREQDVFWGAGVKSGMLLGVPSSNVTSKPVDFRNQIGIYILYEEFTLNGKMSALRRIWLGVADGRFGGAEGHFEPQGNGHGQERLHGDGWGGGGLSDHPVVADRGRRLGGPGRRPLVDRPADGAVLAAGVLLSPPQGI